MTIQTLSQRLLCAFAGLLLQQLKTQFVRRVQCPPGSLTSIDARRSTRLCNHLLRRLSGPTGTHPYFFLRTRDPAFRMFSFLVCSHEVRSGCFRMNSFSRVFPRSTQLSRCGNISPLLFFFLLSQLDLLESSFAKRSGNASLVGAGQAPSDGYLPFATGVDIKRSLRGLRTQVEI